VIKSRSAPRSALPLSPLCEGAGSEALTLDEGGTLAYYPTRPEQRAILAQLRTAARVAPGAERAATSAAAGLSWTPVRAVLLGRPLPRTYARKLAFRSRRSGPRWAVPKGRCLNAETRRFAKPAARFFR
jgi:hypothetical protein